MFWDLEIPPEEEERIIQKTAEKIRQYGMETVAILLLETSKPMVFIGGEFARFFISPLLPIISLDVGMTGEKLFQIFEKRTNIEKLIVLLEQMSIDEKKTKEEKKKLDKK